MQPALSALRIHLENAQESLSKANELPRVRHCSHPISVMLSLYKSLVRPHVEYCISAWNPHYKKDKELTEKVQRIFTKMINNVKGKSYCLKLWTLEERRNRQDFIEVFKMCNGLSRLKLNEFLL